MKKTIYFLFTLIVLSLSSCTDKGIYLPNPSGGAFEVLLIINDKEYNSSAGKAIFDLLNEPLPHLPQYEAQFRISRMPFSQFDNLLHTTRNIVFVEIDSTKFTQPKIRYIYEQWAKTQAIVKITGPDIASVAEKIKKNEKNIVNFLVSSERKRQLNFLKDNANAKAQAMIYKMFGGKIIIPTSLNKYKEGDNFIWISNASPSVRQDLVIYSYPYTSLDQLKPENLLAARDSVMKVNIVGSVEGSYMGTEYKYDYPSVNTISVHNAYAAEIRGLWKMIDGVSMGGPFVSHTRIDEVNQRVVTIEGFVFAPGKDKLNALRQLEAMIYSYKMPQELDEIVITAKKPKEETTK